MRKLTFPTFIKYYLWDLTDSHSLNIHKLAKEVDKNHRLFEPLLLYCLYFDKVDILKKYISKEYLPIVNGVTLDNVFSDEFKDEYVFLKVKKSYERRTNSFSYEKEIKRKLRLNIKNMMKEKNLSTYFIYTSLDLNKGNVNEFISKGNLDKLSLKTTEKIFDLIDRL